MAQNIDPKVVSLIVGAVEKHPDGATLNDILAGFPKDTVRRVVQRWVTALVDAGKLHVDKSAKSSRYFLASPGAGRLDTGGASDVQIAAGGVSTSPAPGARPADQDNRAPDLDKGHVQIASGNVHIPAGTVSTSGQGAGVPAHLDNPGPDVDSQRADLDRHLDKAHPGNVQIVAGGVSTSPAPGAQSPGQDNRAPDLDKGHVQIASGNVQIPAGSVSISGQGAGVPAHLDKAGSGSVQIGSDAVSTSASKPAPPSDTPILAPKPARKSRKKPSAAETTSADPAAALARAVEAVADAVTSTPTRPADAATAKSLAKSLGAFMPGARKSAFGTAVTGSAAILFYTIYHLTGGSVWSLAAMSVAMVAGPMAWSWVTKKPGAGEGGTGTVAGSGSSSGGLVPPSPRTARVRAFCFRHRFVVLAGLLTLLAAGIWTAFYLQLRSRPSAAAVSAWLVKKVAPLPVRVAAIDVTYMTSGKVGWTVHYDARIETTEALYQQLNTVDYLRTRYPNEIEAITAAEKLLAGPDGARLRAAVAREQESEPGSSAAALSHTDFSLSAFQLLSVSAPPGASSRVTGTVTGWREGDRWKFKDAPVSVDRKDLAGETKSALIAAQPVGTVVLEVNTVEDLARLKALITEQAAYAAKVQAAATALAAELQKERLQKAADLERERQQKAAEAERERQQKAADLERERQQKLTALNQLLRRGTCLSGMVVEVPKPDAHPVLLEVTDCSATTHQITFVLHNTSGWYNTRSGKGTWSVDAENETCNARVLFASAERLPGAGWPIDDPGAWYLTLRVRLDGSIAADPIAWDLHCVADADVAATKSAFGYGRAAPIVGAGSSRDGVAAPSAPSGGSEDPRLGGAAQTGARSRDSGSVLLTPGSFHPESSAAAQSAPLSPTDITFFSVCPAGTAYVRVDGVWLRLPRNNAKPVQNPVQKATGLLQNLSGLGDRLAGKSSTASTVEVGELRFDGIETVPAVPANDVVIVYVGPLTPFTADDITRHPELKDYPVMELAPEKTLSKTVRYASLYRVAGGFLGFGDTRIKSATLDRPTFAEASAGRSAPNLTVLRCTAPLARGRYAVACDSDAYEVRVE